MALLNMFDLAESDITDSNYNQVFQHLNETYPEVIQKMDLKTCDLNTFLSEVRFHQLCAVSVLHFGKFTYIYFQTMPIMLCCAVSGLRELKELV